MAEKRKRPVARRTLYVAIEQIVEDNSDESSEDWTLSIGSSIGDLLDCIKDEWFRENK